MGDRKELNKYIPPDFDPKHLSKVRIKKQAKFLIRFMLPCGVQCSTCGEFMGAGKKFNAKKEQSGMYLNIKRFRFYWKCNVCSTQLVMSTDPKNQDYILERGGTRIFDINRAKDQEKTAQDAEDQRIEETNDAMTAMEAKAEASRREMDSLAALETLQANGERHRGRGPDQIMQHLREKGEDVAPEVSSTLQAQEEADTLAAQEAFAQQKVKRIPDVPAVAGAAAAAAVSGVAGAQKKRTRESLTGAAAAPPLVLLKRRKKDPPVAAAVTLPSSVLGVTMYKSSSDDDE